MFVKAECIIAYPSLDEYNEDLGDAQEGHTKDLLATGLLCF